MTVCWIATPHAVRSIGTGYAKFKYRVGHEKVARPPVAFAFGYGINLCIYAMLPTRATFSWPTLYILMISFDFVSVRFIS
jgi:hypothetical protein